MLKAKSRKAGGVRLEEKWWHISETLKPQYLQALILLSAEYAESKVSTVQNGDLQGTRHN